MFQPLPQFYDPVAQILLADLIGLTSLEDVKEFRAPDLGRSRGV
jgi:hypothetical protein